MQGQYAEADRLLLVLRGEVERRWAKAGSPAERQEIATQVTELLAWARRAMLAGRAQIQGKLIQLSIRQAYSAGG